VIARRGRIAWTGGLWVVGGSLLVFLALPIAGLLWTTAGRPLIEGLSHPAVVPALKVSAITTLITLGCVTVPGTALAWLIAQSSSRRGRWLETLVQVPVVIPPAVVGVAMLVVFGRRGLVGRHLDALGIEIPFTMAAVVFAQIFVSAPFFLQAAIAAFRKVDPNLLVVARTLGATPRATFFRVALPLAGAGLVSGAAMSWARALGEFGATLLFAGNLSGRTQTLPLAIYTVLETDLEAAQAISSIMVIVAFALMLTVRTLSPRR
jgi:molybdate transport system permease protein